MYYDSRTICNCDRCGREITGAKGYTLINGWVICGICEFEMKLASNQSSIEPDIQKIVNDNFDKLIENK